MSPTPKTIEQLEREIAYFRWEIERRRCGDRQGRAHRALDLRERQLAEAQRRQAGTAETSPGPDPAPNAWQRVGGGDRR